MYTIEETKVLVRQLMYACTSLVHIEMEEDIRQSIFVQIACIVQSMNQLITDIIVLQNTQRL